MKSRKAKPPNKSPRTADPSPAGDSARRSFLRVEHLPDILLGGATALLVATPLIPSEATIISAAQAPINVLWLLVLLGWGVWLMLKGPRTVRLGWTDAAVAGLIAWNVLSSLVVGMQANGRQTLNMLWQWVAYGAIYFLLRQLARSSVQQRAVVSVMLGLAVLLSAHGYYQYGYSMPRMRRAFEQNPDRVLSENGVSTDPASPERKLFENRVMSKEPLATFALTNSLAGYLAPWLVVALGIALIAVTSHDRRILWIAGPLLIAAILGGMLLLTKSRTAVLATLGGMALLLLYGRERGWRLDWKIPTFIAAAAVVLGLAAVMAGGLDLPVLTEAPKSVLYRLEYWRATAQMIADHPLLGCGPGCFQDYYARYKLPGASEMVADPHNFVLEIWATAGTPALLFLLAVMGSVVWAHWGRGNDVTESFPDAEDVSPLTGSTAREQAWCIYVGAVVGVLLAFPLGFLIGYPPELTEIGLPVIWLVGLPLAAAAVGLLHGWVLEGKVSVSLTVIALVALLVNLMAAGAVSFPGVVNSAWVLLAFSLPVGSRGERILPVHQRGGAFVVLGLVGLFVPFLFTEYRPTLTARSYLLNAQSSRLLQRTNDVEADYRAAAAADPWSSEPWRGLGELRLHAWLANPTDQNWQAFTEAAERFRASNPQNQGHFDTLGRWYLLAASSPEDVSKAEKLARAVEYFEQATNLYPNGSRLWAQLAWTLHLAGRDNEALSAAERALELDRQNPHAEQKLANLLLFDPISEDSRKTTYRPESAEQSLLDLRSSSGR